MIVIATGVVSTVAGSGASTPFADGIGNAATFYGPQSITIDSTGTNLYVADTTNQRIRKIVINGGAVSTVAGSVVGSADGIGTLATFNYPTGITIDSAGTNLYVSDTNNHRIRKIVINGAAVSPFAGGGRGNGDTTTGPGTLATFSNPQGITIDSTGTNLYVVDNFNNRIRKIVIATGVVSTVAGSTYGFSDGVGAAGALFNFPQAITIDSTGTNLYLADSGNNRIRKVIANPSIPTLSTELSFVMNHNDTFAIQMWGPNTTTTSWGGSMLLEKAPMIQGGGGRSVPVPPIPKLHKRSSIRIRKSSDTTTKKPTTKKSDRPLKEALPNPEVHKRTSAKKPKKSESTTKKAQKK
jgi:DNA-binding beta-propeller fold protein YncE